MSAPEDKHILAIDLGTSAAKVALFTIFGEVIGWEAEDIALQILPNGGAEQNPEDWWSTIMRTSKRLLGRDLVPKESVVAVCAVTSGCGTLPVDQDGNPLMNAMLWLDSRGSELVKERISGWINLEGYNLLKMFRWIRITGGMPSPSGKDLVGHTLYIKHAFPEIYHQTDKLLDVLDYIDFRLTGRLITTGDVKAIGWVVDARDPENITYHDGMLKEWGIERQMLPEIKRCVDVIGDLKPDVADELGLNREVKVVAGSFDLPAAAVGSGAVEDFAAHLSLATSAFITVHVPFKKTDVFHSIASLPCAIPNRYLLLVAQEAGGVNLTFLRDNILFHRDALLDVDKPEDFFQALNTIAESAPPGCKRLIYTPWIYGERAPVEDPTIRAGVHNLSLQHTRADLVRAVLEGVAFNSRWVIDAVDTFCGRPMNPINVVGGGANSNLWCQIYADILNRTIRQVRDPLQATARGAAFIAAVGLGYLQFEDIPKHIQFQHIYEPNPENRNLYDKMFTEFVNIYKRNKGIYRRLNRMRI
ncbi:MAG: xylulose kinase [Anaerolineales bacterium]|nr:xylulose kinase [Anaerolineales bacterium]